jgi:hypothetical protein
MCKSLKRQRYLPWLESHRACFTFCSLLGALLGGALVDYASNICFFVLDSISHGHSGVSLIAEYNSIN